MGFLSQPLFASLILRYSLSCSRYQVGKTLSGGQHSKLDTHHSSSASN